MVAPTWSAVVHLADPDVEGWVFRPCHAAHLARLCPGIHCRICSERGAFAEALPMADIAITWSVTQADIDSAVRLRILSTPAAGRDYFDVHVPPRVAHFYGHFHGEIMAETALAMILGMTRGVRPAATHLAGLEWPQQELGQCMRPLRGAHVCILGFGHIGQWTGRLLKPFGVRLTGIRRNPEKATQPTFMTSGDSVLPLSDLDAVLPTVDHLVIILPGGVETDGIIDARRLELLPPHATLTNLGRGNAIDERALEHALRLGRLGGACLDVFSREPLPADASLRSCPNLWRLPHAAAISPNYLDLFVRDFAHQFCEWQKNS